MSDIFSSLSSIDELMDDSASDCSFDTSSPLCLPQDAIEDIELFPNFMDDSISLTSSAEPFKSINTRQQTLLTSRERVALQDRNSNFFANNGCENVFEKSCDVFDVFVGNNKQRRSKREGCGRAWTVNDETSAWTMREVSFARENEVPYGGGARRKCSHCETTETPQWRVGPLGPKTLCNACGVRYKSGRLLPEYRPAASPTFDGERFSNFHRKILKKKGMIDRT